MEHLHHQRRRRVLLLIAAATAVIACSGHDATGDGSFGAFPREPQGGNPLDGIDLGGANDPGSANDPGGGVDPPTTSTTCRSNADCGGGLCTGDSVSVGVCLRVCGIAPNLAAPGVTLVRCLGDEQCIELTTTLAVCLIPCASVHDCPDPGSTEVHEVCQPFSTGKSFCIGEPISKPSG